MVLLRTHRFKRQNPGNNRGGCSLFCPNECCPAVPLTMEVLIGHSGFGCICTAGTLTYNGGTNPDGLPGYWVGNVSVECSSMCDPGTVKIEIWCTIICGQCACNCTAWSMRINEGTPQKIVDNVLNDCCCFGPGGRAWAYWHSYIPPVLASFGCNGETLWVKAWWKRHDSESQCTFTATNGCTPPIPTVLEAEVIDGCGGVHNILLTGGQSCGDPNCAASWGSPTFTAQCAHDVPARCNAIDVSFSLCLLQNSGDHNPSHGGACTPLVWQLIFSSCLLGSPKKTIVGDCDCPTCGEDGQGFMATGGWSPPHQGCGEDPANPPDLLCNSTGTSWSITITEPADCLAA